MKLKPVFTWSPQERMLRLVRVLWTRGTVGDGDGYSAALSLALRPSFLRWSSDLFQWEATVLGVRVHYKRAYGGILT